VLIEKELVRKAKETLESENGNTASIIANDLKIEKYDEINLKGCCPFHGEDTPSFIWYDEGLFFKCFGCGKRYDIVDHYMAHHGLTYLGAIEKLFVETKTKFQFGEKGARLRDYKYPTREYQDNRSATESYLQTRSISRETLDRFDVQEAPGKNIAFHFYDTNDVLKTVKYRPARKLDKKDTKSWSQKGADNTPLLYGMNLADPSKPLVVCEGEIDALAIYESGYANVVSVPFGSSDRTWIEENFDFLEQFEKIIIWSDNDPPGIALRRDAITRLGSWRTHYVDLPPEIDGNQVKDANEVLFYCGKNKVVDLINNAPSAPVQNVVDLADVEDYNLDEMPGLYTGIAPFDQKIYKVVLGTVIVVTGRPGAGKSSLVNQLFVAEPLNQGHGVFYFSGEMPRPMLKSWVQLQLAGRSNVTVKNDHVRSINPAARQKIREWHKGRIWVYDDDDDNRVSSILDKAEHVVRRFGAKVVILDNLAAMSMDGTNDLNQWAKQKELIIELKNFAAKFNALVVLVAHPRKTAPGVTKISGQDIAGSADLLNLCQYAISVHRYTDDERKGEMGRDGEWKKGKEPIKQHTEVDILKNRMTGVIGAFKLYFDRHAYRFYSNAEELWKRYKWDDSAEPIPTIMPEDEIPEWAQ